MPDIKERIRQYELGADNDLKCGCEGTSGPYLLPCSSHSPDLLIDALQAEVARLRGALQPFADFLDGMESYIERRVGYTELCRIRQILKDGESND